MERLGKYQLIRILGEGGMGRVYEAVDPMIGRHVAIKTISLNILNDPDVRNRFLREAQAAGGLSHPNLITIHDVAEQDGHPYIVMEYLEGEDLGQAIVKGQLSLDAKLRLMIDICQGLSYAHARGVIHRDIKPPNIFLTASGLVKIVDFGLARGAVSEFTQTGKVIGTLNYMAPEQIRSERTDPRADIFSAGVVFYELLSGQKAFDGDSAAATIYKILQLQLMPVHSIDPQMPPRLSQIVSRATEKDKNARYQTIDEMLADIVNLRQEMERGQAAPVADLESTVRVRTGQTETVHLKPRQTTAPVPAPIEQPVAALPDPSKRSFDWRWAAAVVIVAGVAGFFVFGRSSATRPPEVAQSTAQPAPAGTAASSSAAQPPSQQSPQPPSSQPAGAVSNAQSNAPAATARPPAAVAAPPPVAPPVTRPPGSNAPPTAVAGRDPQAQLQTRESQAPPSARAEQPTGAPEASARASAETGASRSAETGASRSADAAARDSVPPRPVEPPAPRAEGPRAPVSAEPAPPPAAPTPPPGAPPAPTVSAEAAVQGTLARYKTALESRDLGALKQIWPALVGRQEAAIKMEFDNARSIAVDFDNVNVRVTNTAATLTCRRNYVVTTSQGQTLKTASKMTMTLDRRNGSWVIDTIRHEVER